MERSTRVVEGAGSEVDCHVSASLFKYKMVFGGLLLLTLVTVAVSYVDFGTSFWNFAVALFIASVKASLVAGVFMHLWGERMMVWRFLWFTTVFVVGLFLLSLLGHSDPIPQSAASSHGVSWKLLDSLSERKAR